MPFLQGAQGVVIHHGEFTDIGGSQINNHSDQNSHQQGQSDETNRQATSNSDQTINPQPPAYVNSSTSDQERGNSHSSGPNISGGLPQDVIHPAVVHREWQDFIALRQKEWQEFIALRQKEWQEFPPRLQQGSPTVLNHFQLESTVDGPHFRSQIADQQTHHKKNSANGSNTQSVNHLSSPSHRQATNQPSSHGHSGYTQNSASMPVNPDHCRTNSQPNLTSVLSQPSGVLPEDPNETASYNLMQLTPQLLQPSVSQSSPSNGQTSSETPSSPFSIMSSEKKRQTSSRPGPGAAPATLHADVLQTSNPAPPGPTSNTTSTPQFHPDNQGPLPLQASNLNGGPVPNPSTVLYSNLLNVRFAYCLWLVSPTAYLQVIGLEKTKKRMEE